MKLKPVYLLAFAVYLSIIFLSYQFFGINGAGLAGVAGIVAPAMGFLVNAVVLNSEESETNEQSEPQQERQLSVETLEGRKERAISRLSDHLTLRENTQGEIEVHLDKEDIQGADRETLLYIFGQWAKSEADPQLSPVVTKHEIRENTPMVGRAVGIFLARMSHFIWRHYDPMEQPEMDEKEIKFELNENFLEEIVEFILGER